MSLFGPLDQLRHRPIGDQAAARAARIGCRQRTPIRRDNSLFGEAMAEAHTFGLAGINFYASPNNPPYWRKVEGATEKLLLRQSMGEKLARVNARAGAAGLELFLYDAWRPRAVQAFFHDVWMPNELQRRDPSLTGQALTDEVERYWAAPVGGREFARAARHRRRGGPDAALERRRAALDGLAVRRCHGAGASRPF